MSTNIQPLRPDAPFVDPKDGKLTNEGYDYLFNMFQRMGGSVSDGLDDTFIKIATLPSVVASSAVTRTRVDDLDFRANTPKTFYVPWERPNAIGNFTPNAGSFTRLNAGNGTVILPSFYLGTDKDTGFYRIALNNWGMSINKVKLLDFSNQLVQLDGRMRIDMGTEAAPSIYLSSDTGTGFYRIGSNNWGFSVAGAILMNLGAGKVAVNGQFESTVVTGTPPLVVASTTLVPNLYVARAALADEATHAATADLANHATSADSATFATSAGTASALDYVGSVYPPNATDLPSVISGFNTLKAIVQSRGN